MNDDDNDGNEFVAEEVSGIVNRTVETVIGDSTYQSDKANEWAHTVSQQCLDALMGSQRTYKYIVSCVIMEKSSAGLHTSNCCYWNDVTDGTTTVKWENASMHCVVTVFGLAI
ncbi:t-complex-associated-testis-expressed 1/ dynein light chain [Holotrichia oblita]|uniref:T-complex-associated-testis-expressed 1/ dynein light chain n=2 Tax=Holotrichia oblita TaxID=644536 RepID=A0ACB9TZ81_HOLOL|nr:t-complex-associated-testis-expressed 1/ dynein light chain [Holotrichia oblita]KAI4472079.1 t-complex-associated-testis-expressed 1/ dynein light chain [Holotrichia oblita]